VTIKIFDPANASTDVDNRHGRRLAAALRRRGVSEDQIAMERAAQLQRKHNFDRRALAIIDAANAGSDDDLLTTAQMAVWFGVSEEWFGIGRSKGYGPEFVRLSPRRVRYRRGTAKKYLEERAHRHTGEYADPARPRQGREPGSRVVDGQVIPPGGDGDAA
jgi:hypothetical protein